MYRANSRFGSSIAMMSDIDIPFFGRPFGFPQVPGAHVVVLFAIRLIVPVFTLFRARFFQRRRPLLYV
jgi:hypothetical protein